MLNRRLALLLPLGALAGNLAGCADAPPPPPVQPMPGPLEYKYLRPIRLNVANIEVALGAPAVSVLSPVPPAEAVARMARDRLVAVGSGGSARFVTQQADLTALRVGDSQDRLSCVLRCRLEILSPEGGRVGFAEAAAQRTELLPGFASPETAELVLRRTMDDLNVEFEYQVRRNLRDWLQETPAGSDLPPAPLAGPPGSAPGRLSGSPVREETLPPPGAGGPLPPPVPVR